MRYGHTAVLLEDTIYIWGGRNDTEGACNVLYAFDVSKYPSPAPCPPFGVCAAASAPTVPDTCLMSWSEFEMGCRRTQVFSTPSRFRRRLLKCGSAFRLTQIKIAALFYDFKDTSG